MARVLLVEDHEGIRDLLCEVIRNQGHTADVANTVADAKAALKANDYDPGGLADYEKAHGMLGKTKKNVDLWRRSRVPAPVFDLG